MVRSTTGRRLHRIAIYGLLTVVAVYTLFPFYWMIASSMKSGQAIFDVTFLPGDMLAKVNPYLRPLLDSLNDMLDFEQVQRYMSRDMIEIVPLAFMRGRSLNDTFIILDEGQNTTVTQMKMFLTRMGDGSKIVVTGDVTQLDLPENVTSARTRPGPSVAISSARTPTESSPSTSGRPLTRDRQRPTSTPEPVPGSPLNVGPPVAGVANMAPPGRSRLPVSTLSTSTSQLVAVPKACVVVPQRP